VFGRELMFFDFMRCIFKGNFMQKRRSKGV
jgi:hypothetical protein